MSDSDKNPRVETGPLQIDDDWPGVFIRGDQSLNFANTLRKILQVLPTDRDNFKTIVFRSATENLIELLESCHVDTLDKDKLTKINRR